ncbi:MAG: hypothetical protein PHD11_03090 [Bacteroidales bacterium]|nr:hypothetical protein [Bacteroidales bacterium]MDD4669418.1 hypothetical protein [Bacteroidales bacterium]
MKYFRLSCLVCTVLFNVFQMTAQNPASQGPPDIPDMAAKEADKLMLLLELEDYQVFLVDSVLQHDMAAMLEEMENVKKSGASNQESYIVVSDKWLDGIDRAYQKIFSEKQWAKYLKSTYGKEKKKRDKRMDARTAPPKPRKQN